MQAQNSPLLSQSVFTQRAPYLTLIAVAAEELEVIPDSIFGVKGIMRWLNSESSK